MNKKETIEEAAKLCGASSYVYIFLGIISLITATICMVNSCALNQVDLFAISIFAYAFGGVAIYLGYKCSEVSFNLQY